LLGRTVEQQVDDAELQPARLTVDLLRPVALKPLQVHSSVVREGRRLRLVDAVMTQNDTLVARASALFLRRGEHAADTVWTSPVTMPAVPAGPEVLADDLPMFHTDAIRSRAVPESASPSGDMTGRSSRGFGRRSCWSMMSHCRRSLVL
jgi:hypothetical protein